MEEKNRNSDVPKEKSSGNGNGKQEEEFILGVYDMKPKTLRGKLSQFRTYYLAAILVIAAAAAGLVYFLKVSVYDYEEADLTVVVVNSAELDAEELSRRLEQYLDPEEEEGITVETERIAADTALTGTILPTRIAAGDMDLFIADEEIFSYYASGGVMEDLSEYFSSELSESLSDQIRAYTLTERDTDGNVISQGDQIFCGLSLKDTALAQEYLVGIEDPVLGILINARDNREWKTEAVRFYLSAD